MIDIFKEYCKGGLEKTEAERKLRGTEPMEIYMAEMDLIAQGYGTAELSRISELYVQLIESEHLEINKTLDRGHPISKLMVEHDNLLAFIQSLMGISDDIKHDTVHRLKILDIVVKNLFELEKHIQREERIIFKRLRAQGLEGRAILLAEEHCDIRVHRKRLKYLVDNHDDCHETFTVIDDILYMLRFHTFIENDLLYPVALNSIKDWERVSAESDDIGYCEFLPLPEY